MNLSNLKPSTPRKSGKRVGRGGKKGTFSGHGTKGQKSRAGAGVRPGFRGGDNRMWQLFPKQRGASKKPGGKGIVKKHRFFQLRRNKPTIVKLEQLNIFNDGEIINPRLLIDKGVIEKTNGRVKILGDGKLSKKLSFESFDLSKSARSKIEKAGGTIH